MSYQPEQIQEATKNCKVLRGRGGDVNAEAVANNPNCKKNKKTAQKYTSKEKKAIVAFGLGAIIVLSLTGWISFNVFKELSS